MGLLPSTSCFIPRKTCILETFHIDFDEIDPWEIYLLREVVEFCDVDLLCINALIFVFCQRPQRRQGKIGVSADGGKRNFRLTGFTAKRQIVCSQVWDIQSFQNIERVPGRLKSEDVF